MQKTCSKCGETKSLSEFARQPEGKYGVTAECEACRNTHNRAYYPAYYQANREKKDAQNVAWLNLSSNA